MSVPNVITFITEQFNISLKPLGGWGRIPAAEHAIRHHNALTYAIDDQNGVVALNLRGAGIDQEKIAKLLALEGLKNIEAINLSENTFTEVVFPATWLHLRQVVISPHKTLQKVEFAGDVSKLTHVLLEECPSLGTPPQEVVAGSRKELFAYFKRLADERKIDLSPYINTSIKLILAGNSGVGKTSLRAYLRDPAARCPDEPSTHWLEIEEVPYTLNQKTITLRVFDFGGQEYYHDTHHLFFTNQTAYVLLWDQQSEELKKREVEQRRQGQSASEKVEIWQYPLAYWLDAIRFHVAPSAMTEEVIPSAKQEEYTAAAEPSKEKPNDLGKTKVLVTQNKIDTDGVQHVDAVQLRQEYPFIWDFVSVSLRDKRRMTHFEEAFQEMLRETDMIDSAWPGTYKMVLDAVQRETKDEQGAYQKNLTDFKDFCNETLQNDSGLKGKVITDLLFDDEKIRVLASVLTRLGHLLYYPDVPALKDKVFFHSVTPKIYALLEGVLGKDGVLREAEILNRLKKNNWDDACTDLLNLMTHFKIVFKHPRLRNSYVAPLYLPEEPTQGVKLLLNYLPKSRQHIRYTGFIHKKVVLDFYQTFGPQVLQEPQDEDLLYLWRNGLVIQSKGAQQPKETVLVQFEMGKGHDEAPAYVTVTPLNTESGNLEKEIREMFKTINRGWHTEEMVSANGEDFVPLAKVREAVKDKRLYFEYGNKLHAMAGYRDFLSEEERKKMPQKKLFISYASKDSAFMKRLVTHLIPLQKSGVIKVWFDRLMEAGDDWNEAIRYELDQADVVLFLVSPDFLASNYIMDVELPEAVKRADQKQIRLFPFLVRPCLWSKNEALTKYMLPLKTLPNSVEKAQILIGDPQNDEAWVQIIAALENLLDQ